MKGCLSVILVVVVAAVLFLGYLGFVPGLASAFGSDKPRSLGVAYAQADAQSAAEKAKAKFQALPADAAPRDSLKLTGSVPVGAVFTDEELTALVASHEGLWKYYPVSNVQIKINADGTAEAAGILRVDRAYGYAGATGVPKEVVDAVIDRLQITNTNPPFYVKGTGSVVDNKVTMNVQTAEIGRFSIPGDWIAGNQGLVTSFLEDRIGAAGIQAKSATFTGGTLKFDGTLPQTVGLSPAK